MHLNLSQIKNSFRRLAPLSCFLLLAACGQSVTSNVTRFHSLPAPQRETVEVTARTPEQQNSLEFQQYAALVGQRLGALGYQPPVNGASLLIARIGYDMMPAPGPYDEGPRSSVGIGVGSGGRHSSVGVGLSFPLNDEPPQQRYIRLFTLDIIRRADGVKLYEGRAESPGTDGLPLAMPYLIDALFHDFPGKSGTSDRVKIPVKK